MKNNVCTQAHGKFSAYLDGALSGHEMHAVQAHLDACAVCAQNFAALRQTQRVLAALGAARAPEDLGVRLRVAISQESARRQEKPWEAVAVRWQTWLRPLVVQASAGLAGAIVLIGSLATMIGVVAVPQAVLAHDVPLGASSQPHFLYSQVPPQPIKTTQDGTIVIQAEVNAEGRVFDYAVLSGPSDEATLTQVMNQLMVQVYEPARSFGLPTRGRVLITFAGVSVRG